MRIAGTDFDQVWVYDFEFTAPPGERPEPICMVARELASGQLVRVWGDDLRVAPPFLQRPCTLVVSYYVSDRRYGSIP